MELRGRTFLVSGGGSGLGAAAARLLVESGANVVVVREGETVSPEQLREFLEPKFAKWWLPDGFEFVDEIPKTAVGKFRKTALREQFAQAEAPVAAP